VYIGIMSAVARLQDEGKNCNYYNRTEGNGCQRKSVSCVKDGRGLSGQCLTAHTEGSVSVTVQSADGTTLQYDDVKTPI
jgi:hypothetical protein